MIRKTLPLILLLSAGTALAQARDHAPVGLSYAGRLSHDRGESWNYSKPNLDLRKYHSIIVDRTAVYGGADAQFDGIDQGDRQKFAAMTTEALTSEIGKAFPVVSRPGPGVVRLKMTLLGVDKTTGGVATATRVTPIGFAMSAVKSIRGKQGTFTGSVLYAVELTDARTGELLIAAVRRMTPDALDVPATLGTNETIKAVARTSAKRIRERLQARMGHK